MVFHIFAVLHGVACCHMLLQSVEWCNEVLQWLYMLLYGVTWFRLLLCGVARMQNYVIFYGAARM